MKIKKIVVAMLSVLMLSGILMTAAFAWTGSNPNLPTTAVTINQAPPEAWSYPFATTIVSGVPVADPPYDVSNGGVYTGWCIDLGHNVVRGADYPVLLYSSLGAGLPAPFGSFPWDMINYVLNHKQGTGQDIAQAIWFFVNGGSSPADWPGVASALTTDGYPFGPVPSTLAAAMVTDALANGVGVVPGPGQIVAVICAPTDEAVQDTIIELTVPEEKAPGFTPGFWKHNIEVRLGLTNGAYSAFAGGPLDGVKLTNQMMDELLATVNTMPGFTTLTFTEALANLNLKGWNPLRTDTANAFNAAAGYGPYI
jgi:hypothetical protein